MMIACRACGRVFMRLVIGGAIQSGATCPNCQLNPVPRRGMDALQASAGAPADDWPGCRD
jgi:hypothetical protein